MTRSLFRWVFPLTASTIFACTGDNFAPPPAGPGGAAGSPGGASSGTGGSQAGAGGNAGVGGSVQAGTGGTAGSGGDASMGGAAGEEGGGAGGVAGSAAGAGGSDAGMGGTSAGSGGASAGSGGADGGKAGSSSGSAGANGGVGGAAAGMGGDGGVAGSAGTGGSGGSTAGQAGSAGTAAGSAGSGGCQADNDCPTPTGVCAAPFCAGGVCKEVGTPSVMLPQVSGNCRREICSPEGPGTGFVNDPTDTPEPKGACDVPKCDGGTAKHRNDPLACGGVTACIAGKCELTCKSCPNGSIDLAPKNQTVCYLPPPAAGTIPVSLDGVDAAKAADGNVTTYWNAGRSGTEGPELPPRISFGLSTQKMTVVYLSVTVTPTMPGGFSNIDYKLDVTRADGKIVTFSAKLGSLQTADGRVVFELGEQIDVINLAVEGTSDNAWITVNEVYFRNCP